MREDPMNIEFDVYKQKLNEVRPALDDLAASLNVEGLRNELERLHAMQEAPGFWDNPEKSQKIVMKTKQTENKIENYENIRYRWILSGELLHYLETRKDTRFSEFRKRQPNEVTDIRLDDPLATLYLSAMCLIKILTTFMRKHSTKER